MNFMSFEAKFAVAISRWYAGRSVCQSIFVLTKSFSVVEI